MNPTQVMEAEHRLIETVVKAVSGAADALERGRRADGKWLRMPLPRMNTTTVSR